MAKDDTSKDGDITLDNILSTGENNDRTPIPNPDENLTPEEIKAKEEAAIKLAEEEKAKEGKGGDDKEGKKEDKKTIDTEENKTKVLNLFSSFKATDNLSEENVVIRKELLAKYKGETFDESGNIVDKEGKVLKSFDEMFKDLDNDEPVLDDDGNQVDDEGKVIKTKAELASENSIVNKLHNQSEYEFLDEKGKTKIYSNDEKGLNEYSNDLVQQKFETFKTQFFGQNQELAEIAKHILSGNTLDTFRQEVDYSKIDSKDLSKEQKLAYIRQSFQVKNVEKSTVDSVVQLIEDGNTIDKAYKDAIKTLKNHDDAIKEKRNTDFQESEKAKESEIQNHWDNVNSLIKDNKINIVNIPDEEKEGFYDYVSEAVNSKGNSQETIDSSKESLENKLAISYMRYKGFDFSKLIKQGVQQEKVVNLRSLITRSTSLDTVTVTSSKGSKKPVDISINTLLDG